MVSASGFKDADFLVSFADLVLGRSIGRGANATVYSGTYATQACAVKEITLEADTSSSDVDVLRREATLLARCPFCFLTHERVRSKNDVVVGFSSFFIYRVDFFF
jgi:hypothetical protein